MKVGVLYPRSNAYPEMMGDFVAGIRGSIEQQGLSASISFVNESIGFGGFEKEIYEKTEKLIRLDKVDFIIAYLDLKVLSILQPLLYANDKMMMVVNAGANYPDNWIAHPNFIYLTLQHSFCCWLTGMKASIQKEKTAAVATNFYDAGYLSIAAMIERYSMGGGQIVFNYVNQDIYKDIQVSTLKDFLSGNPTTDILAVFETGLAQQFLNALHDVTSAKQHELFVSPGMLAGSLIAGKSYNFSMQGHLTWLNGVSTEPSGQIKKFFEEKENSTVSVFGIQGWEAGLVVGEIFRSGNFQPNAIIEILSRLELQTPRGHIRFDSKTNYFTAPLYFIEKKAGQVEFNITEPAYVEEEWKNFTDHPVQGVSSGWTNTYLCY